MKKLICLVLTVFFLSLTVQPMSAAVSTAGQSPSNPILIKNCNDLVKINQAPNKHYKLANDIDLTEYNYGEWKPLQPLKGSLDGNGHTISNLLITKGYVAFVGTGLFKENDGIIKNLTIKDAQVICDGDKDYKAGFVAGINSGKIVDVKVNGVMEGLDHYNFGGIAGTNDGIIQECSSDLSIDKIDKNVLYVGGIAGENSGSIYSCMSKVDFNVTYCGMSGIGGIVGHGTGNVEDCIVNGSINISCEFGGGFSVGLIGGSKTIKTCIINASLNTNGNKVPDYSNVGDSAAEADGTIENIYRTPASKIPDDASVFAILLDDKQSKTKASYSGFTWFNDYKKGIDGSWNIKEGVSLPTLASRYPIPAEHYSYSYDKYRKMLTLKTIRPQVTFVVSQGSKVLTSKTSTDKLKKYNISLSKFKKGTKVSFYVVDRVNNRSKTITIVV